MKKIITIITILMISIGCVIAQDATLEKATSDESVETTGGVITEDSESSKGEVAPDSEATGDVIPDDSESSNGEDIANAQVVIPGKKKPKSPDAEKAKKAALKDEGKNAVQEKIDTINFGIESEIESLITDLIANDDPRFSNELYEVFQVTKNVSIREKIIEYFTKMEDPCIEDYAVTVLDDPYDVKNTTVDLVFKYAEKVKCKNALSCVLKLLESEDEQYFSGALSTIGAIGSEKEAKYLVEYLEREDLTTPQKQSLMKVLGQLNAVSIWDKLAEIAQDSDENTFVRMYAAESIGKMKKAESVPILVKLFEEADPNFREYIIKGLSNYKGNKDAENTIIQGIRDGHYKVRLASINACAEMELSKSIPYIVHRAKNDSEGVVKYKAYEVLAKMNASEGNEFLLNQITDKKVADDPKSKAADALMKYSTIGRKEIAELTVEVYDKPARKALRNALAKLIIKYPDSAFDDICLSFVTSKDATTCALGLDMYASGRYGKASEAVKTLAENTKAGQNQKKAKKILKIE